MQMCDLECVFEEHLYICFLFFGDASVQMVDG